MGNDGLPLRQAKMVFLVQQLFPTKKLLILKFFIQGQKSMINELRANLTLLYNPHVIRLDGASNDLHPKSPFVYNGVTH